MLPGAPPGMRIPEPRKHLSLLGPLKLAFPDSAGASATSPGEGWHLFVFRNLQQKERGSNAQPPDRCLTQLLPAAQRWGLLSIDGAEGGGDVGFHTESWNFLSAGLFLLAAVVL